MQNERVGCNTTLLYEKDAYSVKFTAQILDVKYSGKGELMLELSETAFFPEGGGQPGDEGFIAGRRVFDVQKEEGRVWHYLEKESGEKFHEGKPGEAKPDEAKPDEAGTGEAKPDEIKPGEVKPDETKPSEAYARDDIFTPGATVEGEVDFALRFRRMQNHIAEHLFCGLAHTGFGYDNVGFHLSDVVTFDLDGPLSAEDVAEIENGCNEAVWKNVPVLVHYPTPEEAESMEFRSKLELSEGLRLVEIKGFDLCACCAPTLHTTGEIGCIKVLDFMPHRGGTRITLIAGEDAWKDYRTLDSQIRDLMKLFSAKRELVASMAEDYAAKSQAMHFENVELKKEVTELYAEKVLAEIKNDPKPFICFFMKNGDEVQVRNVINSCVKEYDGVLAGFRGNEKEGYRYVCGRREDTSKEGGVSLRNLAKQMKEALKGSGGGSEIMIQGSAPVKEKEIREFFRGLQK